MINLGRDELSITQRKSDFENGIFKKLIEAQAEARANPKRLSHDEVFGPLRQKIAHFRGILKNAH
jgi:hypothetical protein